MRAASTPLLVSGYALAVVAATRLRPAFRHRRPAAVLAFELGTAAVVAGWAARGRWAPAAVNLAALGATAALWSFTGRGGRSR